MKFGLLYLFSEFGDISQERIFSEVLEEIDYGGICTQVGNKFGREENDAKNRT